MHTVNSQATDYKRRSLALIFALVGMVGLLMAVVLVESRRVQAACAPITPTYGEVTGVKVTIATSGTYRVWSRMSAPATEAAGSSVNNSYYLEIGQNVCAKVVGDNAALGSTLTWVGYTSGNTASYLDVALAAGTYDLKIIGREPGVKLDRVLFLSDLTCNPNIKDCETQTPPPDTTPPTVSLTAPNNGQTVQGTAVSIGANASDNVGVTKVEFYVDGTLVNTDTASPYSYPWNTTLVNDGSHTIYAKAYDAVNAGVNSATVSINVDNIPDAKPTVTVTAPVASATVKGVVAIAASAGDDVGVTKVEFYVNGTIIGTDTTSPYNMSWVTTGYADDQNHTITAKAFDTAGQTTTSASVTVKVDNVDNVAPVVTVSSPQDGATLTGSIAILGSATDNVGIANIRILVDGVQKAAQVTSPISYTWNTTDQDNGTHTIRIEATDTSGSVSASVVGITVQNADTQAPAIPSGIVATAGDASITLKWNANTEPDFSHYSVRFKKTTDSDAAWVWPATSLATTQYTFVGLTNGVDYNVEVRAIDNSGNRSNYASATAKPTAPPDTTAPNPPTGLVASAVSSTQVSLRWAASTSTDTVAYNVYRNGNLLATVSSTSFGESGLSPSTSYAYAVEAVDAAQNKSTRALASVSTPALPTNGSIRGLLKGSDGSTKGGYVLTYIGKNKINVQAGETTGLYVFPTLPVNTYTLTGYRRGYTKNSVNATVIGGQSVTAPDIILQKSTKR
jgi:Bacterial Ig domain/Fibronectin type III domain